ncbi:universal stress protein [Amnibacterium setariae]|nr:universal stress protein [Amnibacterium setariae]
MPERVVVGWDGSRAAEAALDWALRHEPDCREVELVVAAGRRETSAGSAETAAARLREADPDRTVTVAREQRPAWSALAARSAPDVLVVVGGADPRAGRHRSSTAYRVAAAARGPVAMVPEGFDHGRDVVLGVGDDTTAPSVALAAAEHAARRRQRLVAVHAWRQFLDLDTMADPAPGHDAQVAKERDAVLRVALAPVEDRYPGLPVVHRVLHGRPVDAVLGAATSASLLVLGRDASVDRRRGRPVAHVALLSSRVPVLVVPRG